MICPFLSQPRRAVAACSAAASAAGLLLTIAPLPAPAQVVVAYSSITQASLTRVREEGLNLRSRTSFGIAGSNVEPINGVMIYDTNTIWRIRDTSKPSSLTVMVEDPLFQAQQDVTNTQAAQAARRESVSYTITGPLSGALQLDAINPLAPVITIGASPMSTSVFP